MHFDKDTFLEPSDFENWITQMFLVAVVRSEEHTSELQSRETISYAVFCLKKKKRKKRKKNVKKTVVKILAEGQEKERRCTTVEDRARED